MIVIDIEEQAGLSGSEESDRTRIEKQFTEQYKLCHTVVAGAHQFSLSPLSCIRANDLKGSDAKLRALTPTTGEGSRVAKLKEAHNVAEDHRRK